MGRGRPPHAPLPHWPALMPLNLVCLYLSMDENSFQRLASDWGLRPVELGLDLERWRKRDLDAQLAQLPAKLADAPAVNSSHISRRRADEGCTKAPAERQQTTSPGAQPPEAMSVADAARAIGVGRSTFYKLIAQGRLQPVRLGRRTLIRRADLAALISAS